MPSDRLDTAMTPDQMMEVKTAFDTIFKNLGFLIGLKEGERVRLRKVAHGNKLFISDVLLFAKNNPYILPPHTTFEHLEKDFTLHQQLTELQGIVSQLALMLEDTRIVAGSQAFKTSLQSYKMAKMAAEKGVPGAKTIVEELAKRFEGQKSGKKKNPAQSSTEDSNTKSDSE